MARATNITLCRMRSIGVVVGVISTRSGLRSRLSVNSMIDCGMVAENSAVWRFAGTRAAIRLTSRTKPRSSIRSASSSTKYSILSRNTARWLIRSSSRPGVATSTSTPRCRATACGRADTPPWTSA